VQVVCVVDVQQIKGTLKKKKKKKKKKAKKKKKKKQITVDISCVHNLISFNCFPFLNRRRSGQLSTKMWPFETSKKRIRTDIQKREKNENKFTWEGFEQL
jgi:hypothetical protein